MFRKYLFPGFNSSKINPSILNSSKKGFTLVELLIVIGVIGVLAGAVLVSIDPAEQLARARDSGRKSAISQIAGAIQAYNASYGNYPPGANYDSTLVTSGELKIFPDVVGGNPAGFSCAQAGGSAGMSSTYCYKLLDPDFIVITHLESKSELNKGTCAGNANNTWYMYSSALGGAGTVCKSTPPVVTDTLTFY